MKQQSTLNDQSYTQKLAEQTAVSQAIFPLSHGGRTFNIVPVETSTYRTVNFEENPDYVLYSGGLTACVVLLIKNCNPQTQKYDNIVTMAHFFPNNVYDQLTATTNINKALADFKKAGGAITKDTSIQLLGGECLKGQDYPHTPKAYLSATIKILGLDRTCKFRLHEASLNTEESGGVYIYANKSGTQILKTPSFDMNDAKPITNPDPALPLTLLQDIPSSLPAIYLEYSNSWSENIAEKSQKVEGMPLYTMSEMLKIHVTQKTFPTSPSL